MSTSPTTLLPDLVAAAPSRRTWSSRAIHWMVDARSHRIICVVMGIWLLNGFDLAFTVLAHEQGMLHEQNPLARFMLKNGTASIILFKIGLVLMGSYPLLRFRQTRISEMGSCLIFAAYVFLAIRWSTCYELYTAAAGGHVDLAEIAPLIDLPRP